MKGPLPDSEPLSIAMSPQLPDPGLSHRGSAHIDCKRPGREAGVDCTDLGTGRRAHSSLI